MGRAPLEDKERAAPAHAQQGAVRQRLPAHAQRQGVVEARVLGQLLREDGDAPAAPAVGVEELPVQGGIAGADDLAEEAVHPAEQPGCEGGGDAIVERRTGVGQALVGIDD